MGTYSTSTSEETSSPLPFPASHSSTPLAPMDFCFHSSILLYCPTSILWMTFDSRVLDPKISKGMDCERRFRRVPFGRLSTTSTISESFLSGGEWLADVPLGGAGLFSMVCSAYYLLGRLEDTVSVIDKAFAYNVEQGDVRCVSRTTLSTLEPSDHETVWF